jgi:hypothetical protein
MFKLFFLMSWVYEFSSVFVGISDTYEKKWQSCT